MRILFLERTPSLRAVKLAAALPGLELGYAHCGTERPAEFARVWDLGPDPVATVPGLVADFRPDVIHSLDGLGLGCGVPVVLDLEEPRSVEGAAAVIARSEELLRVLQLRGEVPRPLVFPNYALRRDIPKLLAFTEHRLADPPRLVYQGTLTTDGGRHDLRKILTALDNEGLPLDVYPRTIAAEFYELEERLHGLTIHEPRPAAEMLAALPKYDFGWAGLGTDEHMDTAIPNKVYEYLACGLPVLAFPHSAVRHLLRVGGLGIVGSNPRELGLELHRRDLEKLRRRVALARTGLAVEANVERLVELYQALALSEPIGTDAVRH